MDFCNLALTVSTKYGEFILFLLKATVLYSFIIIIMITIKPTHYSFRPGRMVPQIRWCCWKRRHHTGDHSVASCYVY